MTNLSANTDAPRLTAVLVAARGDGLIDRTLAHLKRQTMARAIEVLIFTPNPARLVLPEGTEQFFHSVRILNTGDERRVGALRAEGIRQAAAPYVAMTEDHCYPNAVWAEALVTQMDAGADVAGPRIDNADPRTATSWAAYLIAYEPWIGGGEAREMRFLAGHNSCYRRQTAMGYGDELTHLMSSEVNLHWDLADRGHRVVFEPKARCRHVNITRPGVLMRSMFHHSRVFGWRRGVPLSFLKRVLYAGAAVSLVPLLRLKRSAGPILRALPRDISRIRVLGVLAPSYVASGWGEAFGLLRGPGLSPEAEWGIELDRSASIHPSEEYLGDGATEAGDEDPPAPSFEGLVGIGVIGCGTLAREVHLPVLGGLAGARVVAVADPDPASRSAAAALARDAASYANPTDLIADPTVHAVIIGAPTGLHADLAVAAFKGGKHVYLEKPIAATLADGERVVAAWRATGRVGMVGFNYRARTAYKRLKAALTARRIGSVVLVRSTFSTAPGQAQGWRCDPAKGGGVLLDLASHEVDLAAWLLEEPLENVRCATSAQRFEGDTARLSASTASGVAFEGFYSFRAVDEARLEVYGDRGKLTVDRYGGLSVESRGTGAPGPVGRLLSALAQARHLGTLIGRRRSPWNEPTFAISLQRFVDAVRYGARPTPDLDAGLASLRVIEAARETATP